MRRPRSFGLLAALSALLMLASGALPASAATTYFGAKLTSSSQPTGLARCGGNDGIPSGANCTWVAVEAFENGDHYKAPKDGHIGQVRLVTCEAGSFTVQVARKRSNGSFKVVRSGPTISYPADPFVSDGNPDTDCGGDSFTYKVRKYSVSFNIGKGSYIAIKTKKTGAVHCSGGDTELITPALNAGQADQPDGSVGCNLLVAFYYG